MKCNIVNEETIIHGLRIPKHAILLIPDTGTIIVSWKFHQKRENKLEVLCYSKKENKWYRFHEKNEYTEIMWNERRKHRKDLQEEYINYAYIMKHDRKHKKGGGGTRLTRSNTVTDYECTSRPLHDFRRTYN